MIGFKGVIKIDGFSIVFLIFEGVVIKFCDIYFDVDVMVGESGMGGGFNKFKVGEMDILDVFCLIKKGEFDECKGNEIKFIELLIVYDGLIIVVYFDNDFVNQLMVDDFKKIFCSDMVVEIWKDVNEVWLVEKIDIYVLGI